MEVSRCPELNALFLSARDYQLGVQTRDDVKQRLRQMEALYQMMWGTYQQQLRRYEKSAPLWQEAEGIDDSFRRLRRGLEEVREWYGDQSPTHLANGLEEARMAMADLESNFTRVAEREQGLVPLSRNAMMDDVLRVAGLVYDGKLGADILADLLNRMKSVLKQTGQMVFATPLAGDDGETQKLVRKIMERIYAGVKQAEMALRDKQMDPVKRGLEAARVAIEELHDLKERTENPPPPGEPRACWRCSADVPGDHMTCAACGFRFPTGVPATASVDAPAPQEPALRTPVGHTPTEVSERLAGAVEDVQEGAAFDVLEAALQDARGRLTRARRELDSVPPPLGEDAALMEDDVTMLQQGLEMMEQGLERIAQYKHDPDREHLSTGLEMYLLGSDQLMALQTSEESDEPHGAF